VDLSINKVVVELNTGEMFRVLWKSYDNNYGYWIRLDDKTRIPVRFSPETINSADYEVVEDMIELVDESVISDNRKKHRDRIWDALSDVLTREPEIYEKKVRRQILLEAQSKNGISESSHYKHLAKYWKNGKTKNAFLPDFSKRGAKGASRNQSKKIGRPSKNTAFGKVLTEADKIHFEKVIKKYFLNRDEYTLQATYELLVRDFYSEKILDEGGNERLQLLPSDRVPSFGQFYYWYSKQKDFIVETKKRKGEAKFELSGRSVLGKSDYGLMGPGSKYQVDATVGDVYLVSQFDRSSIIGRPVMYFVIDVFSRMVVGMYVGLEGPSWLGMMMAIANAACDKVKFCAEYDVDIKEDEWPCHHVPAAILGDRGELMSKNADSLVSMLGVRIENAPPYRADLKGIIEQHFRTINTNATMFLPGRVKAETKERGGKDYRLDAKLNIRQLTQIIIKCVLFYNNHHYMNYLEKTESMIADNVEAIPIRLWEWGTQNRSGILRSFPEEQIKLALMPAEIASVTGKGIYFKGIHYTCDSAIQEHWFEKARSKKSWRLDVRYDPRDMSHIYVKNAHGDGFELCHLLDWGGKYAGKYLDEIIFEQEKEKLERKILRSKELEAKINLKREIDEVIAEAESAKKQAGTKSKSKAGQLSGIRDNRRLEKEAIRKQESFTKDEASDAAIRNTSVPSEVGITADPASEEYISPVSQMIQRKLKERSNVNE
jgi:hypothetical protein